MLPGTPTSMESPLNKTQPPTSCPFDRLYATSRTPYYAYYPDGSHPVTETPTDTPTLFHPTETRLPET